MDVNHSHYCFIDCANISALFCASHRPINMRIQTFNCNYHCSNIDVHTSRALLHACFSSLTRVPEKYFVYLCRIPKFENFSTCLVEVYFESIFSETVRFERFLLTKKIKRSEAFHTYLLSTTELFLLPLALFPWRQLSKHENCFALLSFLHSRQNWNISIACALHSFKSLRFDTKPEHFLSAYSLGSICFEL